MRAISILTSFVITVLISVTALSVFIFAINPTLQRIREEGCVDHSFNSMKTLATKLEDLATEGIGSSRQMSLGIQSGYYLIRNDTDSIEYHIVTTSSVLPNGTNITRDGIRFNSIKLTGRLEFKITLSYTNDRINITNYERLPQGNYILCIKKVGELAGVALIEIKSC